MQSLENDQKWLKQALKLAEQAAAHQEVPIGAVLVHNDAIIGQGYNQPISLKDPTAHAEIVALRQGAQSCGNYRLPNTTLYVTLEPCAMCVGAMVHARVKRLVFGAFDPKAGAVVSQTKLIAAPFLNHRIEVSGGLLTQACGDLLKQFFRKKRFVEVNHDH